MIENFHAIFNSNYMLLYPYERGILNLIFFYKFKRIIYYGFYSNIINVHQLFYKINIKKISILSMYIKYEENLSL